MANNMIALASNWEGRLRPKKWQEQRPTGLGYIFFLSAYSNTKRKKVKSESNDYLQQTYHNWTKANELQRPCFKQVTKANQRWLKPMWALCTLWLLWKKIKNPRYQIFHSCWLRPKPSRWTKAWHAQILAFTWRLVWHIMNSMLVKLVTNFPKDGQRIAAIGTNKILKLTGTRTKWPCRGTIERATALWTSHLCTKHTRLI